MKQIIFLILFVFGFSSGASSKISKRNIALNDFEVNASLEASRDICFKSNSKNGPIDLHLNFSDKLTSIGEGTLLLNDKDENGIKSYTIQQKGPKGTISIDKYSIYSNEVVAGQGKHRVAKVMSGDTNNFNTKSNVVILDLNNKIKAKSNCSTSYGKIKCLSVSASLCGYLEKDKKALENLIACGAKCKKSLDTILKSVPSSIINQHKGMVAKAKLHHSQSYFDRWVPDKFKGSNFFDVSKNAFNDVSKSIKSNNFQGSNKSKEPQQAWNAVEMYKMCDSVNYRKRAEKVAKVRSKERKLLMKNASRVKKVQFNNCALVDRDGSAINAADRKQNIKTKGSNINFEDELIKGHVPRYPEPIKFSPGISE